MSLLNPKKKKPKKEIKPPKWFMAMMVGFLFYAVLMSLFSDKTKEVEKQIDIAQQAEESKMQFRPLDPKNMNGQDLPMYVRDRGMGSGTEVGCWESVDILYKLYRRDGTLIEAVDDPAKPFTFIVGQHKVVTALERGVLGMKPGGRREITAKGGLAFGEEGFSHPGFAKGDFAGFDVTLLERRRPEHLPVNDLGLRIFSDNKGGGRFAQCTDKVRIKVRGWYVNGNPLWDLTKAGQEPREMIVGQGEAPYAVERALLGMAPGSKRMLIVPPGYGRPVYPEEKKPATPLDFEVQPLSAPAGERKPASVSPQPEGEASPVQDMTKTFTWQGLPIPQDQIILLEVEYLGRIPETGMVSDASDFVQPAQE